MSPEKRAHPRNDVNLLIGSYGTAVGVTSNISAGGLLVETDQSLPLGSEQVMSFVWDHDVFTYPAKVVRDTGNGVALAFIHADPNRDKLLGEMLLS